MSMNPPLHPYPTPCAINTIEGFWDGVQHRHACVNCGFCNGCACPNGAKSSTLVTALRRAAATGRCEIRPECNVRRILLNSDGTAKSAVYVDRDFNEQEQPARLIILSCSTIDTPRLALLSGLDKHDPSGMIGQNFTTHHAPSAVVQINDGVHTWDVSRGTWNTISIDDLQDLQAYSLATGTPLPSGIAFPRAGVVSMVGPSPGYPFGSGGPISLALAFVKPPGFYTGGGNAFAPAGGWGPGFLTGFTGYYNTQAFLLTVCEDVPRAQNKVDLDPNVKDVYGEYVARVTYANHPNDIAVGSFVASQLPAIGEAMLNAIGARGTVVAAQTPLTSFSVGPRFNVHQHGTMRMGATPQRGVVNRYGQFWEVPNLFVADGSLMTTAGGYNPTHTIEALAHWVATHIAVNGASLLSRAPQLVPVAGAPAQLPASTPSANGSAVAALAAGTAMAGAAVSAARRRSSRRPEEPRA